MNLKVYTDGGSRGNPGIAGIGVCIKKADDTIVEQRYKYVGERTNNEAEYLGAYYGVKRAIELGAKKIELYMDSKLVIQQLDGKWKIKKAELAEIHTDIQKLVSDSKIQIIYHWIPREQNKEADRLSNVAMDKK